MKSPARLTALLVLVVLAALLPAAAVSAEPSTGWANRRLDDIALLDSHNGFANTNDGIYAFYRNQNHSLRDQIWNLGVRSTELDIYDYQSRAITNHGGLTWGDNGLWLAEHLATIVDFLQRNPREIFVVRLEDYTSKAIFQSELARVPGIAGLLYDPVAHGNVTVDGWPRVQTLLDTGRRLIMLSDKNDRGDLGVRYIGDFVIQNHWEGSACTDRPNHSAPLATPMSGRFQKLLLINHFYTSNGANRYSVIYDRVKNRCEPATRGRMPNLLSVDWVEDPGQDARRFVDDVNRGLGWAPAGTGLCMDVAGGATADGTDIQLWGCSWGAPQAWRRAPVTTGGEFELRALGKCLDIPGGNAADGTRVQLWTCNGSGAQRWLHESNRLRNPLTGKCLDVPGANFTAGQRLTMYTCNGTSAQYWDWRMV